jgi:sodium/pantothenate symporter
MTETSPATIITFIAYIACVFVLAGLSHRLLATKSFLGEYFLGSRGLGSWALAFTFAATAASGGSFTGFPSLIYSYGWVLAFWIASYMVAGVCSMGVLGKRLNQFARKTGAITIPDVLRDRYESTALGLFATATIIFFTVCNLIAQFKAGALIIEETFNLPSDWGYSAGLIIFAVTVVFYTAYGGFRAVVWTDVLQGVVMVVGITILLPVVLKQGGGMEAINRKLRERPPTLVTSVAGSYNDLVVQAQGQLDTAGLLYRHPRRANSPLEIKWDPWVAEEHRFIEVWLATNDEGQTTSTGNDVKRAIEQHPKLGPRFRVSFPYDNNEVATDAFGRRNEMGATGVIGLDSNRGTERFLFLRGDEVLFGPGRSAQGVPFHPLGMAISFFFMWAVTGMGQPGTMLRLMAFKDSRTLKRAILTVTGFYSMIYLPLVFIFVAARVLIPELNAENSDKAMVLVTTRVVGDMGLAYQILGAVLVAAPFAAVMSTVDSFLLMISSGLVRDIYQRTINPQVSDQTVKRASYATTVIAGIVVTLLATRPPDFLQRIIVFTGSGFAATFLCPVVLGLYWKGMTRQGALSAMVGGFVVMVGFFLPTLFGGSRIDLLGLHPNLWGLVVSFGLGLLVSKGTGPAPPHLVARYFYKLRSPQQSLSTEEGSQARGHGSQ